MSIYDYFEWYETKIPYEESVLVIIGTDVVNCFLCLSSSIYSKGPFEA